MPRSIKIFSLLFIFSTNALPCTTAIVSGKFTVDGRPLLFKHRDTGFEQNKLMYFSDGKFDYIATVNSEDLKGDEVWAGYNSTGFAIMNSEAYNLNAGDTTSLRDREGFLMKKALQECSSLSDFEQLLNNLPKPLGVRANFGVIDAHGGAAYFETGHFGWQKFDANDPAQAPFGYLIRTNFSFSGVPDEGYGYIRYQNAENLLFQAAGEHKLNYRFLLQDVSRSLTHSLTGTDLTDLRNNASFVAFEDYIPRFYSASSTVVQGVKEGDDPVQSVMWTILGFQLSSVAIPVWLNSMGSLPAVLIADQSGNAPLCVKALQLKARCFPVQRGSGNKYIFLGALYSADGSGIRQKLIPVENLILNKGEELYKALINTKHRQSQIQTFNSWVDQTVTSNYKELFDL